MPSLDTLPQISVGEQGRQGDQGLTGEQGRAGKDGQPGKAGADGRPGADAVVDLDALTAAVVQNLPPQRFQAKDVDGHPTGDIIEKPLGQIIYFQNETETVTIPVE